MVNTRPLNGVACRARVHLSKGVGLNLEIDSLYQDEKRQKQEVWLMRHFRGILVLLLLSGSCGDQQNQVAVPLTQPLATYSCPSPFRYNSNTQLCETSSEALGPFTRAMMRKCQDNGGGEGCSKDRWDLEFARNLRGSGDCPYGATAKDGLCIEGAQAYGPFTLEHVIACRTKSGGLACNSTRWERDFAFQTLPRDAFTFPLSGPALANYTEEPRNFGSCRDNCTRRHAAADLYAQTGTLVRSIGAGEVIDFYEFYLGTYALVVDYGDFIVRYGEITEELPQGIRVGAQVKQGQAIAYVGRLIGLSQDMVHFERFAGWEQGPLTNRENYPYQRRKDLVDPTLDLIAWKYPK